MQSLLISIELVFCYKCSHKQRSNRLNSRVFPNKLHRLAASQVTTVVQLDLFAPMLCGVTANMLFFQLEIDEIYSIHIHLTQATADS